MRPHGLALVWQHLVFKVKPNQVRKLHAFSRTSVYKSFSSELNWAELIQVVYQAGATEKLGRVKWLKLAGPHKDLTLIWLGVWASAEVPVQHDEKRKQRGTVAEKRKRGRRAVLPHPRFLVTLHLPSANMVSQWTSSSALPAIFSHIIYLLLIHYSSPFY